MLTKRLRRILHCHALVRIYVGSRKGEIVCFFVDKTFEADIALSPVRIHVGARKALSLNEH